MLIYSLCVVYLADANLQPLMASLGNSSKITSRAVCTHVEAQELQYLSRGLRTPGALSTSHCCTLSLISPYSVEVALQQNEIMNTFIDDWKNLAEEESTFGDKTDTHLKEYQSFTDLHNTMEKMITCVSELPVTPDRN